MSDTAEILLERVDQRLAEQGKSRYWLSKQITDGRQSGVITDLARKGYLPSEPRLRRIAEVLGTTTDWLMGRTDDPVQLRSEVGVSDRRLEWMGPGRQDPLLPLLGSGDCADLEVCSESGELVSIERASFDPDYHVTYITRPAVLRGDREAYAIYFHGESMVPRFEPGEVGIVQPSRPPAAGDYVVVQLRNGESEEVGSVIVKRLVRQNAKEVWLEQFKPAMIFMIPRERVVRMHRLLAPDAALFT